MEPGHGHSTLRERRKKFLGTVTFSQQMCPSDAHESAASAAPSESNASLRKRRREQVLQAQRTHRKRSRDYMTALEDEVVRLRKTEACLKNVAHDWQRCFEATVEPKRRVPLRDCCAGQVCPGVFTWVVLNGSLEFDALFSSYLPCRSFDLDLSLCFKSPTIPPHLEVYDHLTRELLLNFCEFVAPTLCVTSDAVDGYVNGVVPLAAENPSTLNALLAVSSSHLKFHRPELTAKAILYRSAAIRGLQFESTGSPPQSGSTDALAAVSGLATVVLLLVDDMINENRDFGTLVKLAETWMSLQITSSSDIYAPLRRFLVDQVQTMKMLVHPLYEFSTPSSTPQQTENSNSPSPSKEGSSLYNTFVRLEKAVCQSCHILNFKYSSPFYALKPEESKEINAMLDALHDTVVDIPPFTPGEHVLVWVYFVAAAQSTSEAHCAFFTSRLAELYRRIGQNDISGSLGVLSHFWNRQMGPSDLMQQFELICPI